MNARIVRRIMANELIKLISKAPKWGCESIQCKQCAHYVEYLTVSSMQDICRNKGCKFVLLGDNDNDG
jgi:hypothetical protein